MLCSRFRSDLHNNSMHQYKYYFRSSPLSLWMRLIALSCSQDGFVPDFGLNAGLQGNGYMCVKMEALDVNALT